MSDKYMVTQTLEMQLERVEMKPINTVQLRDEDVQLINGLSEFEAPYLEEKLLRKEVFSSNREYREAFTEFKKYAAINKIFGDGHGMASEKVDAVWHQFILFTREYHSFCNDFLGKYLHHSPKTSHTPLSKDAGKNLMFHYRQIFGDMPSSVWNKVNGSSDCGDCCSGCNCDD